MVSTTDTFTPLGPDWYNVYLKENGTVLVKPCAGVMTFSRAVEENLRIRTTTYSGFVQFKEDGDWSLASNYAIYHGTFHIPDFHELDDETFKQRYIEQVSALGWTIE
jgi:hypothetical protein